MPYRRRYYWPEFQLSIWIILSLAASATCLGVFAWFLTVQSQMGLGTPWIMPFMVTTGSLGVCFIIFIQILAAQRSLLPGVIMTGSFILFVLWLTGLIDTAIQLFSTSGNINANCQTYVVQNESRGNSLATLAWLTQNTICNCWKASFAWELVNVILYLWLMIMCYQVNIDFFT
ncbi:hypothetical protein MAP00_002371 [Monascus purpureus]|nr:hypothetical protein MAP00_002371 [Monascus purpureus]